METWRHPSEHWVLWTRRCPKYFW